MFDFIRTLRQSVRRAGRTLTGTRRRRSLHSGDSLESRTLLASLVSATKISYQDADGDNVTVTLSKAVLTAGNVNSIFTFDVGTVDGSNTTKQQLRTINLTGVTGIAGTTITTAAVRSTTNGGDGFAALGQINATGIDIGAVTIDGDLGRILAGDATTSTQAVGALKVHSIGRYGTLSGATNLETVIQGKLASLTTKSDVKESRFQVFGDANGQIGSISIGGSLIGGATSQAGRIIASGNIGAVTVKGNVIGGAGAISGSIRAGGKLASVTIDGSVIGGAGGFSGNIHGETEIGEVNIKGDVIGSAGEVSGTLFTLGKLASVTIGGSLIGGAGNGSGMVYSTLDMGAVSIKGNLVGGTAMTSNVYQGSGAVISKGKLTSVTIGGSMRGGSGEYSGMIRSELDMGPVTVSGDIQGSSGDSSGLIYSSGKLGNVTVGGSLIGGSDVDSGVIFSILDMGAVKITGDVKGGSSDFSGHILTLSKLASATIGGSLIGGEGAMSGRLYSGSDMGTAKITGDVRGGAGVGSGSVVAVFAKMTSLTLGGSLTGGSGEGAGVLSAGEIMTLAIGGNIYGGSATGVADLSYSGAVLAQRIGTLTLKGSLIAGSDDTTGEFELNGAIQVKDDIANLTIEGSLIGNSTNRALILARGQLSPSGTTDLAIGKLTINGRVEHSLIAAGYSQFPDTISANADAQIGPVVIGGDWIASSLVAGATPGGDGQYGNANDAKMFGAGVKDVATVSSKITSIVIGGQVMGTPTLVNDHFGFVAENIGSFKVKGGTTTYSLTAGNSNDDILLSLIFGGLIGSDTRLNEI
jgi:hypothetical protein